MSDELSDGEAMTKHRTNQDPQRLSDRVEPEPHWKELRQGDRVSVHLAPEYPTGGLVDAVTEDSTAVWVHLDGGRGRALLHCSDGVKIVPQGR